MEKEPVMSAWEAIMAARVAITTMGHSSEEGTLSQYAEAAASGLQVAAEGETAPSGWRRAVQTAVTC